MPAIYPGAVAAFTTKNDGDVIAAAHMNAVQDEIAAIENSIVGGAGFNVNGAVGITGNTFLNGTLGVAGNTSLQAAASVAGALTVGGTISERGRSVSMGTIQDIPFNAANFTAAGGMTWTLDAGDQAVNAWAQIGQLVFWSFVLNATSVGGTLGAQLQLKLPPGITISRQSIGGSGIIYEPGGLVSQLSLNATGAAFITLSKASGANFVASTNATSVFGQAILLTT